jgi:hypothetical protein
MSDLTDPGARAALTPAAPQPPAGWYANPSSNRTEWWDGARWSDPAPVSDLQQPVAPRVVYVQPAAPVAGNGMAVASLILGIWAIVTGIIPLFIGLVLSAVPALLAVIFGILGVQRAGLVGRGAGLAVTGLVLGALTILLYFVGYGTIW